MWRSIKSAMAPLLLLIAAPHLAAQTDTVKSGERTTIGFLAGLALPLGSEETSNDLIPTGSGLDYSFSGHITLPVAGAFGLDLGFSGSLPRADEALAPSLADRLYPGYFLLSNDIARFRTTEIMLGPTYCLQAGRLTVEPALLATATILTPQDQRLFLKRNGSNEYRSIIEQTKSPMGFALIPALTISYRLRDSLEAGIQLRTSYLDESFTIAPTITSATLTDEPVVTTLQRRYTRRALSIALGLYRRF